MVESCGGGSESKRTPEDRIVMTLALPQFLLLAVLMVLFWVGVDWVLSAWRGRRVRRRAKNRFRECHLCGKVYEESPRVKMSDCPDCAAANTKRGHRRLA